MFDTARNSEARNECREAAAHAIASLILATKLDGKPQITLTVKPGAGALSCIVRPAESQLTRSKGDLEARMQAHWAAVIVSTTSGRAPFASLETINALSQEYAARVCNSSFADDIAREVEAVMLKTRAAAEILVEQNSALVEKLTDLLLEQGEVTSAELVQFMESTPSKSENLMTDPTINNRNDMLDLALIRAATKIPFGVDCSEQGPVLERLGAANLEISTKEILMFDTARNSEARNECREAAAHAIASLILATKLDGKPQITLTVKPGAGALSCVVRPAESQLTRSKGDLEARMQAHWAAVIVSATSGRAPFASLETINALSQEYAALVCNSSSADDIAREVEAVTLKTRAAAEILVEQNSALVEKLTDLLLEQGEVTSAALAQFMKSTHSNSQD